MAQIGELIKSPEEKFQGEEEEFTAPSDAILTALNSLDDFSGPETNDLFHLNKGKSPKKVDRHHKMDSSPEKNGEKGRTHDEVKIIPVSLDDDECLRSSKKGAAKSASDSVEDVVMGEPADEMSDFEKRLREEPIDHEINVDFEVVTPTSAGSASLKPTSSKRGGKRGRKFLFFFTHSTTLIQG